MKRSEKEQIISEVKEQVARAKSMFFADFTGITVEEVNELRREFRKSNVGYRVVKNTLVRKALEGISGYDKVNENLVGPDGNCLRVRRSGPSRQNHQEVPGQASKAEREGLRAREPGV